MGVELLAAAAVGLLALGGAIAAALGVALRRGRDRRNQVVPGVPTTAPASWAGSHVPEARLHRRLRAAVEAAAVAAPDPSSPLSGARRAIEEEALAVDERLVVVAAVPERERGPLLVDVRAQVAGVETAAASLARGRLDEAAARRQVDEALEQVRLLAEARAEVERLDRPEAVLDTTPPPREQPPAAPDEGHDDEERRRGTTA